MKVQSYIWPMKRAAFLLFTFLPLFAKAQNDSLILQQLRDEILMRGTCYENLRVLTKSIGHRLSGSPQAELAVHWSAAALRKAGADSVWLQPVWVPRWVRGKEQLSIKLPGFNEFQTFRMLSLGNSVATGNGTLEAPILMVEDMEAFQKLTKKDVEGKIVFFNYRFRQDWTNTFEGYGDAVKYRWMPPGAVASKGGVGVIIRSVSTGMDDAPHTGMTRYYDTLTKIPAVAIGNLGADRLEAACRKGAPMARLLTSGTMKDSVLSYNVIGELKGSEFPKEYIVVGGHLDSWDVGEGAHDDGAGCVQSIEVIRALKALKIRPRRTIRAVMFMNEENGARGGRAYADSVKSRNEKHAFALESDAGGFSPRGVGLEMSAAQKAKVKAWAPYFQPLNVYDFEKEEGGVDIGPLQKLGVPLAGLLPDPQRYFDYHHTEQDVFEAVNHRELKLGAATMATLIYLVDRHGL